MDINDEPGSMSTKDVANHAIAAAGPSMYSQKQTSFGSVHDKRTDWLVEIPLDNPNLLPAGQKVNLLISELHATSERTKDFIIFITARAHAPPTREYATNSGILNDFRLITTTEDKRAEAYKVLYKFVNDMREICQGPKYAYIMQEIVNLAQRVQGENSAYQLEDEDPAKSSLELAAVLLEMDPAELAKTSVAKVTKMAEPFKVTTGQGEFSCHPDGTVINFNPDTDFSNLNDEEQEIERKLLAIARFNVAEWIAHHKMNDDPDIDLWDIGFWRHDGTYEPPNNEWRSGEDLDPLEEAMSAKDLAIQSVGLPTFSQLVHNVPGEDTRTYGWKNTAHGYTLKIRFSELHRGDRLILKFNPWVETKPTIYDGPDGFTLYDGDFSGKGDIYTRIWRALHDLKEAHDAGIDKEDLLDLAVQVFHKEAMVSDQDQEKKGRPVI